MQNFQKMEVPPVPNAPNLATFVKDFKDFLIGVAYGHESGMFKNFAGIGQLDILLDIGRVVPMIRLMGLSFFNDTYDGIALLSNIATNNVPRIQMQSMSFRFSELCRMIDHSPVCIINIAFRLYMQLHENMNRSKFDISSYDAYMMSVKIELEALIEGMPPFEPIFSHECKGDRVCEPLPPGKKMFYLLPSDTPKCAQCKKPKEVVGKLRKCTGCNTVVYCGVQCQRKHWLSHKSDCNLK